MVMMPPVMTTSATTTSPVFPASTRQPWRMPPARTGHRLQRTEFRQSGTRPRVLGHYSVRHSCSFLVQRIEAAFNFRKASFRNQQAFPRRRCASGAIQKRRDAHYRHHAFSQMNIPCPYRQSLSVPGPSSASYRPPCFPYQQSPAVTSAALPCITSMGFCQGRLIVSPFMAAASCMVNRDGVIS